MNVSQTGWWVQEAGPRSRVGDPLTADLRADVAVIGGGYTGMWAAWHITELAPAARVVILEADRCGHGPSGRNGGFCESYWRVIPALRDAFGDASARRLADASSATVTAIGDWCTQQNVDAWFVQQGSLLVATGPRQRQRIAGVVNGATAIGAPKRAVYLTPEQVRSRCASPVFGDAALIPDFATVQPARLAFGLRERLLDRGVEIYERTRVELVEELAGGILKAHTADGSVTAASGVAAINHRFRSWPQFASRTAVASSHIVLTEPIPDVLDDLGWTGGECITDAGTLVHYFRTTRDRRIAFGWAGGPIPWGARAERASTLTPRNAGGLRRALATIFPQLATTQLTHGWGGPIDVSPNNLPQVDSIGRLHVGFGYSGNGVGPSHLVGRTLASLALDLRDEFTSLPIVGSRATGVPPEPFAVLGGRTVRAALAHRDRRDVAGRRANLLARAAIRAPELLGIRLGR